MTTDPQIIDTVGTPLLWGGFVLFVLLMLALDLGVFHRRAHSVSLKEAASWSAVWVALSLLFNLGVYLGFGPERGLEFATGYLIEKALSVDNIFVFVVIFGTFAIPAVHQHRVLFWGVLGALVMRAVFIVIGGAFLTRFHWAIYLFGGILVLTGVKLLMQREQALDPARSPAIRLLRRLFPVSERLDGQNFFTREDGIRKATPLLLALVAVEFTDLVFAIDSIPAVFAVTRDPFIVFTSNIFAMLGLRSLYFLLAGVVHRFHLLKVGLALVLVFVGAKMTLVEIWKVPVGLSLAVIALLIGGSIALSIARPRRPAAEQPVIGPSAERRGVA
jgi:tellurite resistance protein TerC